MKMRDRQAGLETDNAMAVHVMGWYWQHDGLGNMAWFAHDEPVETGWGEGGVGYYKRREFHPSTDIIAAWVVLEEFTWPDFYVSVRRTDNGGWRCDIEVDRARGRGPNCREVADTAPLAICRAALAAVGV